MRTPKDLFVVWSVLSADARCCWVWCVQESHGGQLLKISSAAEDDFVRLNLLWTGFFGETCEGAPHQRLLSAALCQRQPWRRHAQAAAAPSTPSALCVYVAVYADTGLRKPGRLEANFTNTWSWADGTPLQVRLSQTSGWLHQQQCSLQLQAPRRQLTALPGLRLTMLPGDVYPPPLLTTGD